jgi:hypothetical protein
LTGGSAQQSKLLLLAQSPLPDEQATRDAAFESEDAPLTKPHFADAVLSDELVTELATSVIEAI